MNIIENTLTYGTAAGIIHFFLMSIFYKNPFIDNIYTEETSQSDAVKKWKNIKEYLLKMFLGTQVEVFIVSFSYLILKKSFSGSEGAFILWGVLSAIRVYPRFWNMWIQSTYPGKLLIIEFVNGIISTGIIIFSVYCLMNFFN